MIVEIKDAVIWKAGKSWVFTVPKTYVDSGIISPSKKYSALVKEEGEQKVLQNSQ